MTRDWIDQEHARRQQGVRRPLHQSEHAQVNSRYPGCTIQTCKSCGKPTGKSDGEPICGECAAVEWELDRQDREEAEDEQGAAE